MAGQIPRDAITRSIVQREVKPFISMNLIFASTVYDERCSWYTRQAKILARWCVLYCYGSIYIAPNSNSAICNRSRITGQVSDIDIQSEKYRHDYDYLDSPVCFLTMHGR